MTRRLWWSALAIGALALAASANSIVNDFTYDDGSIVAKNTAIHTMDGWSGDFGRTYWPKEFGGDGYRPLTLIAFRAQWVLGGGKPLIFHATNIALHVAVSVVVFWLALALLPVAAAWIGAALYAVHPVHVEAIAGVVGQSELAVALLLTSAVALYLRWRAVGALAPAHWLAIGALYAPACFVKEHGIVLPALLVLAEATVVSDRAPLRKRLTTMRPALLALTVVALAYLWARGRVVRDGGTGYAPFLPFQILEDFSTTDRVLTMIGVAPEWLRLLVWPARLMTEYGPPRLEIAQGPSLTQLPGLFILVGIIGLIVACWRRSPATSFGLGWLVVTLLPSSNFLLPAGVLIAERTLLLPSVGAMIAVGSAVPWLYARLEASHVAARYAAAATVATVLGLGIARSYTRNRVWRDDESLFRQAVIDAPDSYRSYFVLGTHLFKKGPNPEAERHYRRALELFPYDPSVMFQLAEQYRRAGMCQHAIPLYRLMFEIAPSPRGQLELTYCLLATQQPAQARRQALLAIRLGSAVWQARQFIAVARALESPAAPPARADSLTGAR